MIIAGLTKLSLIDYPGKISCIVFTQGCNFRCPFCHNPDLVKCWSSKNVDIQQEERIFTFLKSRIGKLQGVVITGGEPTLHSDLISFIQKIKALGFLVKLDTNGTNPDKLEKILEKSLIDYVAMDIKHIPKKYEIAAGASVNFDKIHKSIKLIQNSGLKYEFRTTILPGMHTKQDILSIGEFLQGSQSYFLQAFRKTVVLDRKKINNYQAEDLNLEEIRNQLQSYFDICEVRK